MQLKLGLTMIGIMVFGVLIYGPLLKADTVQAADPAKCDPSPLFKEAATLKASGDAEKDITTLSAYAEKIHQASIACRGMKFEGSTNKAIGVVEFPAGTWLATVTTKGYFILHSKVINGDCDLPPSIFTVSEGDAADSISSVFESKGCKVLFTSELVSTEYVLSFEPVS